MKATGIVRRIDDLGRVVIPKEIRRTMRIREGDPLEIYTDRNGEVIFKKYSPIGELLAFASQYADTLFKTAQNPIIICDRDSIVAFAGLSKKEFFEKKISPEIEAVMEARTLYTHKDVESQIYAVDGNEHSLISCAMPIIAEGDILGAVMSIFPEGTTSKISSEVEIKLIQTAAVFLGKQLEE